MLPMPMRESFHDGLEPAVIQALIQDRRDGPGLLRVGTGTVLFAATGAWVLRATRHPHDLADDPELGGYEMLARWPTGIIAVVDATGLLIHALIIGLAATFAPRLLLYYVSLVVGHRFVNWWMWNMPYHAEHHGRPAVPFHQFPRLNALLKEQGLLAHEGQTVLSLTLTRGAGRS